MEKEGGLCMADLNPHTILFKAGKLVNKSF